MQESFFVWTSALRSGDGPGDDQQFEDELNEVRLRTGMRILAYCIMPNHWHLVLWPERDGDLTRAS